MSQYYKGKRSRNIYSPSEKSPFRLSRSKIDLFLNCPQCFYIDRRLGVAPPPGFPFAINSAVDNLLKSEFDFYRNKGEQHPLQKQYQTDAIPAKHEKLNEWRENFVGVQFHHLPTNLIITGAIDDLWINSNKDYIVVDYKATSKEERITALDKDWQNSYKRQMEVYQWLLRKNNLSVSDTGYFVYCNGNANAEKFNNKVEFEVTLIPYQGNDNWIEETLVLIKKTLDSDTVPESSPECDICLYRRSVESVTEKNKQLPLY